MDMALIASFLLLTVPAYFSPGPNNLMLMTSAAKFGPARTLPHALGIIFGFPFMVLMVGLGLGELFNHFPWLNTVLKYLAAAYLLWMAWHLLGLRIGEGKASERPMSFIEGALFQWVNPKAWAMATSFVAAFVISGEAHYQSLGWVVFGCLALAPFSSFLWMIFGQQLQILVERTHTERFLGFILALLVVVSVALFLL